MIPDLPAATEVHGRRLASWLLRPYVDLGPLVLGPLYARGIDEYWHAFISPRRSRFALQRTLPPAFRMQLVEESGRPEYLVEDPRELQEDLRTDRWSAVCAALDDWHELPDARKNALVLLLHSLCLYTPVLKLVPEFDLRLVQGDMASVEMSYWRASARYVLGMPSRIADYNDADMSVFKTIAVELPDAIPAALTLRTRSLFTRRRQAPRPPS